MAFSFILKVRKVWAVLQSFGSEFQIVAPLYAKLYKVEDATERRLELKVGFIRRIKVEVF